MRELLVTDKGLTSVEIEEPATGFVSTGQFEVQPRWRRRGVLTLTVGDGRNGTALLSSFPKPYQRHIPITDPPSLKVGDLPLTLTRTKGRRLKDRRLIFEGTGFMWSLTCDRLGGDVTVRDSNDQIVLRSRGQLKRRVAHRMFVADTLSDDELALAVLIVTFNIYEELSHFVRWVVNCM